MASKTIFIGGKEMLTAHGIADYFGVSLSTVQNWERMGKMRLERDYTDSSRGTRFILPQELEKLKKKEKVRENKYVNNRAEKERLLTFLSAMNINTVEDFMATFMTAKPTFTQPTQSARDIPAARFDDTMSTPEAPAMLLSDEPVHTYWSSSLDEPNERLPIDPESVDMMFDAWIESPSHPEITCRADVNVNNGLEAVKGAGHLLWTSEV